MYMRLLCVNSHVPCYLQNPPESGGRIRFPYI